MTLLLHLIVRLLSKAETNMKSAIIILLTLLMTFLSCQSSYAQTMTTIGRTSNGELFLDEDSVQPLKKDLRLYLLFTVEEHYTNAKFLQNLRNSKSELANVTRAAYLYLFTNDGLHYAIPKRMLLEDDGTVALDLGGSMKLQPVKSKLLLSAYEKALQSLERQQMLNNMLK